MRRANGKKAAGQRAEAEALRVEASGLVAEELSDERTPGRNELTGQNQPPWRTSRWWPLRKGLALSGVGMVVLIALTQIVVGAAWSSLLPTSLAWAREDSPEQIVILKPAWFHPLWFADPAELLRAGGDCMVNEPEVSHCKPALMLALRANHRATQAALWMAQIASFEGNEEVARWWYAYSYERDSSFAVVWAWANSGLAGTEDERERESAPATRQPVGRQLPRGKTLWRQLLLGAPPAFEAHIPLLLGEGLAAQDLYMQLVAKGQPEQTATLLRFLLRNRDPDSGRLVYEMLEAGTARPGLRSMPCAELARYTVTNYLRAARLPTGVAASVSESAIPKRVWRSAVRGNAAICDAVEGRLLPDKRLHPEQDPVWNFNPGLRLPLIPESFDWSVSGHPASQVSPLSTDGGLLVTLDKRIAEPLVVLARPLPVVDSSASPHKPGRIEIRMRWQQKQPFACADAWQWELRDRNGEQRLGHAPVAHSGQSSTDSVTEARYVMRLPEKAEFPQLVLRFAPQPGRDCGRQVLALERVNILPVDEVLREFLAGENTK